MGWPESLIHSRHPHIYTPLNLSDLWKWTNTFLTISNICQLFQEFYFLGKIALNFTDRLSVLPSYFYKEIWPLWLIERVSQSRWSILNIEKGKYRNTELQIFKNKDKIVPKAILGSKRCSWLSEVICSSSVDVMQCKLTLFPDISGFWFNPLADGLVHKRRMSG